MPVTVLGAAMSKTIVKQRLLEMQTSLTLLVIGAGEVGTMASLIAANLDRLGVKLDLQVVLLESRSLTQTGAKVACNLLHATGYEYLKTDHIQTGLDCIEGAATKALLFPVNTLNTGVLTTPRCLYHSK